MDRLSDNGARDGASDINGVRRRNAAAAAEAVLLNPSVSRAEVSRLTGLTRGAVTKIVSDLIARGVLAEGVPTVGRTGRPRVPLHPAPEPYRVAGIHIGIRWCTGALVDLTGHVVHEETIAHTGRGAPSVLENVATLVDNLENVAGGPGDILGLGVSTGGWVDPDAGVVVAHPLMTWSNVNIADGLPARPYPMRVDNTVRALARAEFLLGASRDGGLSMHAFVGNFVGVALASGAYVHSGAHGAAGLIDHLPVGRPGRLVCRCGRRDCFGVLASDLAVTRLAIDAGILGPKGQFEDLLAMWESGDRSAGRLLEGRAKRVGRALGLLGDIHDPGRIILSGNVAHAAHLDQIRAGAVERSDSGELMASRIVLTQLGRHTITRGPASLALAHFYADPLGVLARR